MIPRSRPVLCHVLVLFAGVLLVTLLLCSTIATAAINPAAGLTVKPGIVVARTTVTPTPVPTVTCTAPCECLSKSQATTKWGSAFTQCQATACGYMMSDLTADTTKYCFKPAGTPQAGGTFTATLSCPSGQTACRNSYCADTSTDSSNCGSCGNTCSSDKACSNGQCVLKIIPPVISNTCPNGGTLCNGVCTNTQGSDSNNCGGCGWVCPSGLSCYQGECSMDCPAGFADCQYDCVDLTTNADHCGSCGTSCPVGWNCCNGKCTDTKNDASSCGGCGWVCPSGLSCYQGECSMDCPSGFTDCQYDCVDLKTNAEHCGTCGNECETTKNQVCKNGLCACKPGMLICDTNIGCSDVQTNWEHCGSCNNKCASPEICVDGTCQFEPTCGTKNYQTNTYETCADNIQNQDETGVDCGGSRCAPCNTKCTTGTKYAPADTPCTSVYNYQSKVAGVPSSNYPEDPYYVNMYYDACPFCNYPCRSNEVCHPALDPMIEEALKCCSLTSLDDIDSQMPDPDTCKYAVKMAPYGCQKCTGIYIIKELADGTRWMHGYNDEQNTAQANLSKKNGQTPPYGTANYLLNYYHTGICHDYATAVTTLLRKAGYPQDDVGSYCDGAHCYNVVRFPGDTKWNVVDTDATQQGGPTWTLGKIQSGYPYCHTMDETSLFYNMSTYYTGPIPDINAYWNTVKNGQTYSYEHKQPFQPQCTGPGSATPCSIVYGGQPLAGPGVGGVGKDYWQLPSKGVQVKQLVGC